MLKDKIAAEIDSCRQLIVPSMSRDDFIELSSRIDALEWVVEELEKDSA